MRRPVAAILLVVSATAIAVTLQVARPSASVERVRAVGLLDPATSTTSPFAGTAAPTTVAGPAPSDTSAPSTPPTTPAAVAVGNPVEITLPTIGVTASVVPVGVQPGTNEIEVPPLTDVGWYRFGARPGELGSSVLVGHVDGDGRTGVFWRLRDLQPGDPVKVRDATGRTRHFVVSARAEVSKSTLPADLFSRQGPTRLVLITCGGAFDYATHHYVDNVVVVASPES
jgi:hypothetical protein